MTTKTTMTFQRSDGRSIRRSQHGLSLIELMVALALSLFLVLGLVEIFGSSRAAFGTSEGLARTQENGRFAMDFVRRDLRMAGQMGCLSEMGFMGITDRLEYTIPGDTTSPLIVVPQTSTDPFYNHFIAADADLTTAPFSVRADLPVQVFDYTGTEPEDLYTITSSTPAGVTAASNWTPPLPTDLGLTGTATGSVIPGSDVVVVRYFDEGAVPIVPPGLQTNGTLFLGTAATATVVNNAVYGLGSCARASLFQVTAVGSNSVVTVNGANVSAWDAKETYQRSPPLGGASFYRYRVVVYYVGRSVNDGVPALFRKTLFEAPTSTANGLLLGPGEELVDNVEMMQIVVGTAPATVAPPPGPLTAVRTDSVTAYSSITTLMTGATTALAQRDRLRRITSLRLSLLVRSPGVNAGINPADTDIVVGDVDVTPPVDQRLRQVYDTVITFRNRTRQSG